MSNEIQNLGGLLETTKMFQGFILSENELAEIRTLLQASPQDKQKCRRAARLQYYIGRRLRGFFKNCPRYFERQIRQLEAEVDADIAADVTRILEEAKLAAANAMAIDLERAGRIISSMHETLATARTIQRERNADKAVAIARELSERKLRLENLVPVEHHAAPGKPVPLPVTITAKDSRAAGIRGCRLLGESLQAALAS